MLRALQRNWRDVQTVAFARPRIVFEDSEWVYLVRETKGSSDSEELRGREETKIRCARQHFDAIGVDYAVTSSVEDMMASAFRGVTVVPPLYQPLTLPPGQLATLRSAMRDLQVSIGDYYRCSEGFGVEAEVLATPVRSSIGFVQVLNELLRKQTSRTAEYCAIFEPPLDSRAGIIQAVEYVRHVTQHIDPVRPQSAATFGGAWDSDSERTRRGRRSHCPCMETPDVEHQGFKAYLRKTFRAERSSARCSMLARFFAEVCRALVDRQANGEWTGFPLRHQPACRAPPPRGARRPDRCACMDDEAASGRGPSCCLRQPHRRHERFDPVWGYLHEPVRVRAVLRDADQVNDDIAAEVRILRG